MEVVYLGFATAVAAYIIMWKINMALFVRYDWQWDLTFSCALLFFFAGTFSGAIVAVLAGIFMSVFLVITKIFKRIFP